MCYMCLPTCEKCFPKTVACPSCGKRNTLRKDACVYCGAPISEADKQNARQLWAETQRESKRIGKGGL